MASIESFAYFAVLKMEKFTNGTLVKNNGAFRGQHERSTKEMHLDEPER